MCRSLTGVHCPPPLPLAFSALPRNEQERLGVEDFEWSRLKEVTNRVTWADGDYAGAGDLAHDPGLVHDAETGETFLTDVRPDLPDAPGGYGYRGYWSEPRWGEGRANPLEVAEYLSDWHRQRVVRERYLALVANPTLENKEALIREANRIQSAYLQTGDASNGDWEDNRKLDSCTYVDPEWEAKWVKEKGEYAAHKKHASHHKALDPCPWQQPEWQSRCASVHASFDDLDRQIHELEGTNSGEHGGLEEKFGGAGGHRVYSRGGNFYSHGSGLVGDRGY